MHQDADIELRLLRAAHNDLDRTAVRHPAYDPALYSLVSRVVTESRAPHPVLALVPMNRRTCRIPHNARKADAS